MAKKLFDNIMGLTEKTIQQQKAIIFGSWFGWALDGYDLVLM
jgi:hypothetical protein